MKRQEHDERARGGDVNDEPALEPAVQRELRLDVEQAAAALEHAVDDVALLGRQLDLAEALAPPLDRRPPTVRATIPLAPPPPPPPDPPPHRPPHPPRD